MADEKCAYVHVLRDAKNLCIDVFVKWLSILIETSNQTNLSSNHIFDTVVRLFCWVAHEGETNVQNQPNLREAITEAVENRSSEHGVRYKSLVMVDTFWDEKRLQTLKDSGRGTQHHHVVTDGVGPLLDELKTVMKRKAKKQLA